MIVSAIIITVSTLLGVIILCLAAIRLEKAFPGKKYDEMQMLSRYRSYRLAFIVGILYYLATIGILINQGVGTVTIEPYMLVTIGFLLQIMVSHTYCLLTHAALPLSDSPCVAIGGYIAMGIMYLLSFRGQLVRIQDLGTDSSLFIKGNNFALWSSLVYGILFLYLAALHLIQALRKDGD